MTWRPLPSAGSGRIPFPRFAGTMGHSDVLRPSRRASLPSLGDTLRCACRFVPIGPERRPWARGSSSGPHCRTGCARRRPGPPRFLENPLVPMPCSSTPAGPRASGKLRCLGVAPAMSTTKAPTTKNLSGLNRTALGLAVYASSDGLPTSDARLASGCLPGSTGRDWLPAGFLRKVSEVLVTSLPPFPGFPWRKDSHLFPSEKITVPLSAPHSTGERSRGAGKARLACP